MGTILASDVIRMASEVAQDESNVLWTQPQALAWLNDAMRMTVYKDPDANVLVRSMQMSPGTKQEIAGNMLYTVVRNMGANGQTPGDAVRLVDRGIKDEFDPGWHAATAVEGITEYMVDDRSKKFFYVSPPQPNPAPYIEVMESADPDEITAVTQQITVDDTYVGVLVEWICYRFFSRDSEETSDMQRPAAHFERFFQLLGVKVDTEMATSPKLRAQLN